MPLQFAEYGISGGAATRRSELDLTLAVLWATQDREDKHTMTCNYGDCATAVECDACGTCSLHCLHVCGVVSDFPNEGDLCGWFELCVCRRCNGHCACPDVTTDYVPRIAVGCMLFDLAYWATEQLESAPKEHPFLVRNDVLLYTAEQPHRVIKCVSDILHRPWFKVKDRKWLSKSRSSRATVEHFISMVERGDVRLLFKGDRRCGGRPEVVCDAPLPWFRNRGLPPGTRRADSAMLAGACSRAAVAVGGTLRDRIRYGGFIIPDRNDIQGYTYDGSLVLSREMEDILSTRSTYTTQHVGRVLRHPLSDELPVNILVSLLDVESKPGLWLLADKLLLATMGSAGVTAVVAGCGSGAILIDSKHAPTASADYVLAWLDDSITRGPTIRRALYPPITTCERILRHMLRLQRILAEPMELSTVAGGTGTTVAEVVCALANPRFVDMLATECGCYARLLAPRAGSPTTRMRVGPAPKESLVGSMLATDETGQWTVAVTGAPVTWANGHVALSADGRGTRKGEEGSGPVNGTEGDGEHRHTIYDLPGRGRGYLPGEEGGAQWSLLAS